MFERYTYNARRTIFFARYEASQYGSRTIETEHLLLGLTRGDERVFRWIPKAQDSDTVRRRIEVWVEKKPSISTALDLPLGHACKHVLHRAKDEADRLNSKSIGTEHLFLSLLREENCQARDLLIELGADADKLQNDIAGLADEPAPVSLMDGIIAHVGRRSQETITIHGTAHVLSVVLDKATYFRQHHWHWHKRLWQPRDAVIERKTGKMSFNLEFARDDVNFELVKDGWKKDQCGICRWELFESKEDEQHSTGYTNGRDWICLECFEKFWSRPDFIAASHADTT